jgi:hypothetical protein
MANLSSDSMKSLFDNFDSYRYQISSVTISGAGSAITIEPNEINSLIINSDYDNNVLPSYSLNANVKKEDYNSIVSNMDNITVSFTVSKGIFKRVNTNETISTQDEDTAQYSKWQSFSLKAVNQDNLSVETANQLMTRETDVSSKTTQSTLELNLYLYDSNSLEKYRSTSSYNMTGYVADAVCNMFSDRGFSKVVASDFDIDPDDPKGDKMKDIQVAYGSLGENLESLNQYYGLYKTPYLFFMAPEATYLLNKSSMGKNLQSGEMSTVNIYLSDNADKAANKSGCYVGNGCYALNAPQFDMHDYDSIRNAEDSGQVISMMKNSTEESERKKNTTNSNQKHNRAYLLDNYLERRQLMYSTAETKRSSSMEFDDIDVSILTPNKKFQIISDNSYSSANYGLDDSYRMIYNNIVFTRNSDTDFKCTAQIQLTKIPSESEYDIDGSEEM